MAMTVVERMESLDKTAQRLSYTLLTNTPFYNCLTTMAVRNLGPRQAELERSAFRRRIMVVGSIRSVEQLLNSGFPEHGGGIFKRK